MGGGRTSPFSARTPTYPLGVALLLAAVFGVLLVVIPGTARIMQLRRTARHRRTADVQQRQAQGGPPAATADNPDHHPG
jgi:hypothetical protein